MRSVYSYTLLENTFKYRQAKRLKEAGFLNQDQLKEIGLNHNILTHQKSFHIRACLFVVSVIAVAVFSGFLTVLTLAASRSIDVWKIYLLMSSCFGFFILEYLVRDKKFGEGVDDGFLAGAITMLLVFVGVIFNGNVFWPIYLVAIIAGVICCIRYVDSFSAFIACAGFTALIANGWMNMGAFGKMTLPFVMTATGGVIFWAYRQLQQKEIVSRYWDLCLKVIKTFSLLLFYLSGNYMIVRQGNEMLMHTEIAPGSDIPLAWIFYIFTIAVPVIYIYIGLKNKDRIFLRLGILALAFGIYSIKMYHHLLPTEWALMLAGAAAFAVAYFAIRKLRGKEEGLTYEPDRFTSQQDLLNAEAIMMAENFAIQPAPALNTDSGVQFGGGEFGGGGSGGAF
jgi:hypothetical protein